MGWWEKSGRRVGRWRLMRKGGRLFRHGTTDIILESYLVVLLLVLLLFVQTKQVERRTVHYTKGAIGETPEAV